MTSLSPRGRALLEAYRAVSDAQDAPDDAMLARLEASIESPAEPPKRAAAWIVAGVAMASTVTAVIAWPRPQPAALEGRAAVSEAVDAARAATPRRAARPPANSSPEPTPEPSLQPPGPSARPGHAPATKPVPAEPAPETSQAQPGLVAELALLRKARAAMRRGDLDAAAQSLSEHGRSFPTGQLSEDRDALWVVLRCRKGAANDGRAAFEAAHPSSHHLAAIAVACGEKD